MVEIHVHKLQHVVLGSNFFVMITTAKFSLLCRLLSVLYFILVHKLKIKLYIFYLKSAKMFGRLKNLLIGPTVYRIHKSHDLQNRAYDYPCNKVEERTHFILNALFTTKQVASYTSPLWMVLLYRRGYFTLESAFDLSKLAGCAVVAFFFVLLIRAFGRHNNQEYISFLDILENVQKHPDNLVHRTKMRMYSFDFASWPVDFKCNNMQTGNIYTIMSAIWQRMLRDNQNSYIGVLVSLPKEVLAYLVAHTFGIRVTYPGCVGILKAALGSTIDTSRSKLIEEHSGIRAKLLASDGNEIDTMFVDRRSREDSHHLNKYESLLVPTLNADYLVICCEGNAGFYEVGCMCTPMQAGYSVLGWNHPGFGCSSGQPFPNAETCAVDVVMQYAINCLLFKPEKIILFGWSIGAYTVIQAANMYPDIHGIVLDATFHDIMPFARNMMPPAIDGFINFTVRKHINLHNAENLNKYNGPVAFIRRMQDEVMNIGGRNNIKSNLGNILLEKFLRHRYPNLFESKPKDPDFPGEDEQSKALWDWLLAPDEESRELILSEMQVDPNSSRLLLETYGSSKSFEFPFEIGECLTSFDKTQLVLFLANKHMSHYSSSHCTPLPAPYFCRPWNIYSVNSKSGSDFNDDSSSSDFEVVSKTPNL